MKKRVDAVLSWEVGMCCIVVQDLRHWTDKLVEGMVQRSNNRQMRKFHLFLSLAALNKLKYWSQESICVYTGGIIPKAIYQVE